MRRALLVLALLMPAISLAAQSWDALRDLKTGEMVKVLDTAGQEHRGGLRSVDADRISLRTERGEESIDRARVRKVQVRSGERRVRNAVIGAAIGVAVGLTVDQTLGTYFRNESGQTAGARTITYIAPIGIFGGIGAAWTGYRTVYRAR